MHLDRAFLAVFTAVATFLGAVSSASAQGKGQVVVASWGGTAQDALREAILKPFEKATGIKVVEATFPSISRLRPMIETGSPEWDVVDLQPHDFVELSNEGKLQQLDYNAMDRSVFADFPKGAVQPSGVGTVLYAKVIAFNTKKYTRENGPRSWADVWDVNKFPGPRIIDAGNYVIPPIEYVLLADGVAPGNLYPLDFKRAYAAFSRIKPNVVKWATSAALETEALVSGEGVIGPAQQGRIEQAKQQGAPVDYVWNQALIEHSYWGILKGAKNIENAQKFIEFASRADSQAAYAKLFVVGPLNRKAFDLIPVDRAKVLPTYPENVAKAIWRDAAWWAKKDASGKTNQDINSALWNAWTLQK